MFFNMRHHFETTTTSSSSQLVGPENNDSVTPLYETFFTIQFNCPLWPFLMEFNTVGLFLPDYLHVVFYSSSSRCFWTTINRLAPSDFPFLLAHPAINNNNKLPLGYQY